MSASESATPHLYVEALSVSRKEVVAPSTRLFRSVLVCVEVTADFLTCTFGTFAAHFFIHFLHTESQIHYTARQVAAASIAVGLLAVLFLQRGGAYRGGGSLLQIRETERALRVPVQSILVLLPISFLLGMTYSYAIVFFALILTPVLLIIQKLLFFSIIRTLHAMGYGTDRAVIYGTGDAGKRIISALFQSVRLGILPVAVIDDNSALDRRCILEMGYRRRRSVPVHMGPVTPELLKSLQCSILILALPNLSPERQTAAIQAAKQAGLRVAFLSGVEFQERQWTQAIDIDGLSLTPEVEPRPSWHCALAKRMVDLILSSLLLVLLGPLFLLIAFLIKLDSRGPVLFIQIRVGRNGELFNIFKFRSMYIDSPKYDLSPTTSVDPRITRFGRFLRQTSLDEFPQLINVLLGDMSLVGPRPEMPFIVQNYTPAERQRLQMTPGITGLWQLSADRAYQIHENIQYDLYYIRNRSFFMDIAILVHTLLFAVRRGV